MHHIRATLPDIKVRIAEQQKKFNAELQSLGGMVADNSVRDLELDCRKDASSHLTSYHCSFQ